MKDFNYYQDTKLVFGAGRVEEVGVLASEFGQNCLLVTTAKTGSLQVLYDRVIDILEKATQELNDSPQPSRKDRFKGWYRTTKRRFRQRYKSHLPGSLKSPQFERHRYPPVDSSEISARLERFRQILGYGTEFKIETVFSRLFRISA